MDSASANDDRPAGPPPESGTRPNGHDLIAIDAWLPGAEPIDADSERSNGREYRSRYWRCRACGAEHEQREAFDEPCEVECRPTPAIDGGYSVGDERTRRARSERLTVRFVTFGPGYAVDNAGGERCYVDGEYCEHLRRVDLAIRTGERPGPDGRYVR